MNQFQNVFISYGRTDSKAFAKQLNDRLAAEGLEVWFDFDDIPLGVDYQNQIDEGIEQADNFLFVIAPHSVNSPYCAKEVELALQCHKRIIPLLHVEQITQEIWQQRRTQGTEAEWADYQTKGLHSSFSNLHPELAKINWVYFREGIDDFDQAFHGLLEILTRQQQYVRQHTLFLAKALEWERQQKQSRYLLVGDQRQQAEAWLKVRFKDEQAPCTPSDLHCEFITECIKNANNLMTQVFISYAEEEILIMEQVRQSMRRESFTVWTNKTDIQTGASFQESINRGIEEADNLVYLLSPASLQSTYCQQELDYALSLNKRIIPLLVQPTDLEQLPPGLKGLQYIDLTDNTIAADYQQDENQLVRILRQDAAYYEDHKVLLTKALKWERQNRNPSILLRGYNLQHAEAWLKVGKPRSQHLPLPIQEEFIAASLQQPPGLSLDVFVSYSRADSDFARKLNDALQMQGKTTWFDQESIASGSDFQREIYRGIENSNNFLFVISPNAVSSPYCADEVEYAQKLNKRIVTVLHRPVEPKELHSVLAAVQWIDFEQREGDFSANFKEVLRTIDTDPVHLQAHTRLLVRAIEWDSKGRKDSFLLRGDDLEDAEKWVAESAKREPKPNGLQQDYVNSSRSVETANHQASQILKAAAAKGRQRVMIGTSVMAIGLVVASIAGAFAYKAGEQAKAADTQAKSAQAQAHTAEQKEAEAHNQVGKAETQAKRAQTKLTQATIAVKVAERQKLDARQQVQVAEHQLATAAVKTVQAEQKLQQAQQKIAFAQQSLNQAQIAQKEAQVGTTLERQGSNALKQFESQQLDALVEALRAGQKLKSLVKDGRSLDQYPAVGPLLALQIILTEIKEQKRLFYPAGVMQVNLSPDGKHILAALLDGTVQVQDLTGKQIGKVEEHGSLLYASLSPDNQRIITVTPSNVRVWDLSGHVITEIKDGKDFIRASFSPDGKWIATAQNDSTIKIWDALGQKIVSESKVRTIDEEESGSRIGSEDAITCFSPDGKSILTASDKIVRLLDLSGHKIAELTTANRVTDASFSPDGKVIIMVSGTDHTAQLWDLSNQKVVELIELRGNVTDAHFSPDGRFIVTPSVDHTVRVWSWYGREIPSIITLIAELKGHRDVVTGAAFSPDDKLIMTGSLDQTVRLWNFSDQAAKSSLSKDSPKATGLVEPKIISHSPNGQRIVTASVDEKARILDRSGQVLTELKGHQGKVNSASFSPDGQRIVTASADGTVRIWDLQGREIAEYRGVDVDVIRAGFSSNGQQVIATTVGGDLQVLRADNLDTLVSRACSWLNNSLGNYLKEGPGLSESDRHLCDDQLATAQKPK